MSELKLEKLKTQTLLLRYNHNHDAKGRFASTSGGRYRLVPIGNKGSFRVEIDENDPLLPETIANVAHGEPMTREQADSYNVNPNYGKAGGYSINCQTCVVAYEARLRGYDVIAGPNNNRTTERLAKLTNTAWIDPETGRAPKYIRSLDANTPKKFKKYLDEKIDQDKRYTLEFTWRGGGGGHIINLDKDSKGQLRITDTQRGKGEKNTWVGDEVSKYLTRIRYGNRGNQPAILRIDNLQFNEKVVNEILKPNK